MYSNSNFLLFCNGIFQNIGILTFVFLFYSGELMYVAVLSPPLVGLFLCSEPSISLLCTLPFDSDSKPLKEVLLLSLPFYR